MSLKQAPRGAQVTMAECRDALRRVEIPLRDLEYAIEAYLLAHGQQLDTGTRCFLAQVRDGVERVAQAAREVSDAAAPQTSHPAHPRVRVVAVGES